MIQPEIIPVPPSDQQTRYSLSATFRYMFAKDPADKLRSFVEYVLWECSTEFMVSSGMPTDKDVSIWVDWLSERSDVKCAEMQIAIGMCTEYIKPMRE